MKLTPIEFCTQRRDILGGFDNARWIGEAIESGLDFEELTYNLPPEAINLINQLATKFVPGR
ncbi:MAG: hypothetical protein ACKO2Z_16075 [Sphaerospermopsis kisseleviana]